MSGARVDLFRIPTRIHFGRGAALTVGDHLAQIGSRRALVVTDRGVRAAGLLEPIEERIRSAGALLHRPRLSTRCSRRGNS